MCTNVDESSHSKRKALELITNIFRKKSKESSKNWNETENYPPVPTIDSNHEDDERIINIITPPDPQPSTSFQHSSDHLSEYGIPPHSPVSPRVKNIDEDMEALTLSRQDNPFIVSKLEKLSSSGDWLSPTASSLTIQQELLSPSSCSSSLINHNHVQQSTFNMEIEDITSDESNLHQHLIRSPPPQFPTKLSHFVFPLPNSPIKNLSSRYGAFLSPDRRSDLRSNQDHYRSGPINLPSLYSSPSSSSTSSSSPSTSKNPVDIKLTYQSNHSLSIRSPKFQANSCRKNSIAADKVIVQSSSSTQVDTLRHIEGRRASTSGSCSSDVTKLTAQSTNSNYSNNEVPLSETKVNCDTENTNQSLIQSIGEDNQTKDVNDRNWNHNNLSNSREALILSEQSSFIDAIN